MRMSISHGQRQVLPLLAAGSAACLGGTAIVATRMMSGAGGIAGGIDVMTLSLLRYGLATLCFVPLALLTSPRRGLLRGDIPAVIGLGLLYFGIFPLLFTAALSHTTAARGGLVVSLVPVLTLLLAVALRRERASPSKVAGVLLATCGVVVALTCSIPLASAATPALAAGRSLWQGDLLMLLAAISSAAYGVLSRPFVQRNGALPVMGYGMVAGSLALLVAALSTGSISALMLIRPGAWMMIGWLAIPGCALAFFLLVWAYGRAEPSRVAVFLTLNPIIAMLAGGLLLGEDIGAAKLAGLLMVIGGIAVVARGGLRPAIATPALRREPARTPHTHRVRA